MGRKNAAWFVAALLLLMSVLMTFHLMSMWVSVQVCREYSEAVINPSVTVIGAEGVASYCGELEVKMGEAVDKYLSVLLSLIGGAAVSGGVAVTGASPSRRDDGHDGA